MCLPLHMMVELSKMNMHEFPRWKAPGFLCFGSYPQWPPYLYSNITLTVCWFYILTLYSPRDKAIVSRGKVVMKRYPGLKKQPSHCMLLGICLPWDKTHPNTISIPCLFFPSPACIPPSTPSQEAGRISPGGHSSSAHFKRTVSPYSAPHCQLPHKS